MLVVVGFGPVVVFDSSVVVAAVVVVSALLLAVAVAGVVGGIVSGNLRSVADRNCLSRTVLRRISVKQSALLSHWLSPQLLSSAAPHRWLSPSSFSLHEGRVRSLVESLPHSPGSRQSEEEDLENRRKEFGQGRNGEVEEGWEGHNSLGKEELASREERMKAEGGG